MLGVTHIINAMATGACASLLIAPDKPTVQCLMIMSSAIGGITPDIDFPAGTKNGKWQRGSLICHFPLCGLLGKFCAKISSHRRFWHTVLAALIFTIINFSLWLLCLNILEFFVKSSGFNDIVNILDINTNLFSSGITLTQNISLAICLSFFFFLGFINHLVLDSCNPHGIPWKFPFDLNLSHKQHIFVPGGLFTTGSTKEAFIVFIGCIVFSISLFYIVT